MAVRPSVQRLIGHLVHALALLRPGRLAPHGASLRGGTARGAGGHAQKLILVLERNTERPLEGSGSRRQPDPRPRPRPQKKRRHGRYRTPFFTPVRRRGSGTGPDPDNADEGRSPHRPFYLPGSTPRAAAESRRLLRVGSGHADDVAAVGFGALKWPVNNPAASSAHPGAAHAGRARGRPRRHRSADRGRARPRRSRPRSALHRRWPDGRRDRHRSSTELETTLAGPLALFLIDLAEGSVSFITSPAGRLRSVHGFRGPDRAQLARCTPGEVG